MKAKLNPGTFAEVEFEGTAEEIAAAVVALEKARQAPAPLAPAVVPSVWLGGCPLGGACQYPTPWYSVSPAACTKCGRTALWSQPTWTVTIENVDLPSTTLNPGMGCLKGLDDAQDLWHGEGP